MTPDDEAKVKTYGKLIKYSKRFIDVDADVIVEADSTLKKDSAVLRKQIGDIVNLVSHVPGGQEMIDWELFGSIMADLSSIPAVKRLIKMPQPQAPQGPQMPQGEEMMPGGPQAPRPDQMLSNQAIMQSVRSPQSQV